MAKKSKKRNAPCTKAQTVTISNNKMSSRIWRLLKKLFTVQTIALIIAIVTAIIALIQLQDTKKSLEYAKMEKYNDDNIKYHENLILTLGGFHLKNREEYNIDIVRPYDAEIGMYVLGLGIYNGGKLNAKNIHIQHKGNINYLTFKSLRSKNILSQKTGGEFDVEYIYPKEQTEFSIMYMSTNPRQGLLNQSIFTCICEDKANPYKVKLNMFTYNCNSIEEYISYMQAKYENIEELEKHWINDNFFLVHSYHERDKNEQMIHKYETYKVIKQDGEIMLQSMNNNNI
ncbi:hypothetical protein [Parabacteroides distasonis]|uniref:hypothetical protein n=1 Tax=Parabacteroides distasonis TaxID=823 RepID=UPI0039B60538